MSARATGTDPPPLLKPLLRGWLHLACLFAAIPVGLWLIAEAPTAKARIGAVIYAVGLTALFGVSGLYHCGRWGSRWRSRLSRLDHSTIFVMIAGSYTPLCLVALAGPSATLLLAAVWTGATAGAVLSWVPGRRSAIVAHTLYIALGWLVLLAGPQLIERLEPANLWLLAAGGILFTLGAITLATHRPNPFPRVFGYHEVWHLLVVAAVVCQLIAIADVVRDAEPADDVQAVVTTPVVSSSGDVTTGRMVHTGR